MDSTKAAIVYLGLGANLGDRLKSLGAAIEKMQDPNLRVLRVSSVFETDPLGPPQPDYLNAVAKIQTLLTPQELLLRLKGIERDLGRTEGPRWGPRLIDLDILLFGGEVGSAPGLQIPHPELATRSFAWAPLLEIDPDASLPSGERLSDLCGALPQGAALPPGIRHFAPPAALWPPAEDAMGALS